MAENQIDRLTVGVGLTNDEFRTGVDEILESINGMRSATESAAEGMSASFASMAEGVSGLALKFTGLFFAIRGIEDVVGYFKDLSGELAHLGFAGEYLGQSSVALRRWGEVAQLAGGHAEDAVAAAQSLQTALFNLEYNGQMSQNLLALNRLRIPYQDKSGHLLPIQQIEMSAAVALEAQWGKGKANEAMRVSGAEELFGRGGIANAVGGGVTELRKFLSESVKDNKSITQKLIDSQKELQQDTTRLSYEVANSAAAMLGALTPSIEALIHTLEDEVVPALDDLATDIGEWLHPIKTLESAANGPMGWSHPINDLAHFGAMIGGGAADFSDLWKQHFVQERKDQLAGINVPASVASQVPASSLDALKLLWLLNGGEQTAVGWQRALDAYRGMGSVKPGVLRAAVAGYIQTGQVASHQIGAAPPTPGSPRPPVSPEVARPAGASAGSVPTASLTGPRVAIGSITVHTQATDANGMAASLDRAMQRKLLAAQSEPGLA